MKKSCLFKKILSLLLVMSILMTSSVFTLKDVYAYSQAYELPELTGDQANDTVNIALSQMGYSGADGTVYGAWWNEITNWGHDYTKESWCAMFACWCMHKAGVQLGDGFDKNSAMCRYMLKFMKNNCIYDDTFATNPQPGDIIFFGPKGGESNHVAIVVNYNPDTKLVTVVGGNQGSATGGTVTKGVCTWKKDAPWGSKVVMGYGRPNYKVTDPVHKPIGEVETVTDGNNSFTVSGWAYDEDARNSSVEVKIYLDEKLVGTTLADKYRDDISCLIDEEETVLEGKYGFECKISFKPLETSEHTVKVYAVDPNERYEDTLISKEPIPVTIYLTPFEDVALDAYYYDSVIWAVDNEITTGMTETLFGSEESCTRAQAITFLWRLCGKKVIEDSEIELEDVPLDAYYHDAVIWAIEKGVSEDTIFRPDDLITRAEFVEFLWKLAGKPSVGTIENTFTDITEADKYFDAVLWAVEQGITTGIDETHFGPENSCTRAQIVTFLYRYDGYEYLIIDDKIVIVGLRNKTEKNVVIPEEFRGYPVIGFESQTFAGSDIESIVIPDTISEIPAYAFDGCTNLTSVKLSNTLIRIGTAAFRNCSSLTSIVIPEFADSIGLNVFEGCELLESAGPVGSGCDIEFAWKEEIPDNAFYNSAITYVEIPNTVKRIGYNAFYSCGGISSIYIPYGVETIDAAFKYCSDLTEIIIPKSVTYIERMAFLNCKDLIIYGYRDTTAQKYALNWNMPFILMDPFSDVSEDFYYYEPVNWAIENRICEGIDSGHFGPDEACNRAQSVTFIWRAYGSPEPTLTDNPFEDISKDDYFYKAVLWALENGITTGMDETHFGPELTVTRANFVTFLWRAEQEPEVAIENSFEDVLLEDYFYHSVLWALENDITTGIDETHFVPYNECNRAQVVTFLYRAFGE